jgi:hypothetical protein
MTGEADAGEFVLAERLGRTVEELRQSMTHEEFVRWQAFFVYRHAMDQSQWKEKAHG